MARSVETDLPLFRKERINDPTRALKDLAAEAETCRRCPLYKNATQTLFGEGPADAFLMLGEQPGEQAGRPFVGPAGKVLDAALEAAGIDRAEIYLTNAVKHFKHESSRQSAACIRSLTRARSTPAGGGSTTNGQSFSPR